ncbi:hypothetical protein LOAG_05250 [Loa loa]|uniref:Uncharacterized protein n=1 Tax=Loa loa TaxID=7209 RepID=A0A1S0U212_LOALO|nr:hypothetical protein LOAG_05250 [Loa loa]EFO23231.1 hypothetical protein LOAG_05250 [Loa loa]
MYTVVLFLHNRQKSTLLNKSSLLQPKDAHTSGSPEAFSQLSCSKNSTETREVSQSRSTSLRANLINNSEASLLLVPPEKRRETKSSATISSLESKTDKINNIESQPKTLKGEVKKGAGEKKQKDWGKKKKERKKWTVESLKPVKKG